MATLNKAVDSDAANGRWASARAVWDFLPGDMLGEDRPHTLLALESGDPALRVLRDMLREDGYRILEAARAREAFALLKSENVDLIVLDLTMPEIRGLDFCRAVKAGRETRFIPVVMIADVQDVENEVAGILSGAEEFLVKPLHPAIVRTRIRSMLRHKRAIDSLEEAESILFALAQAVEQRDRCTSGHCDRLATLSMALGTALGLPRSQILALHRGGYLHDIGKIGIPDAVLFKEGALTPEEWDVMRTHTVKGEDICRPARTLAPVLPIIRSHHERWDGSGYPDGLRGEEIPLLARILQVADVFDALTSTRPYKAALPPAVALNILKEETRRGWRDPAVFAVLEELCASTQLADAEQDIIALPKPTAMERSLANMRVALAKAGEQ
ncbi:MAG: HD-GYP domain-containing protein [Acidobacteriota bacterium]